MRCALQSARAELALSIDKACGDSCIAAWKTCHKGKACACNGELIAGAIPTGTSPR